VLVVAATAGEGTAQVFVELGIIVAVLAVLARGADRVGFSPIPLYLLVGLAFGDGGILPLSFSEDFIQVGADIGVILLLFMLGLEYTGDELAENLRIGAPSGALDFALNFTPGLAVGLVLGWSPVAALLLGGVTYISSSGVISKVLTDLGRLGNRETPAVLTILVIEDLVMAAYLPLVAVLLLGTGLVTGVISLSIAIGATALALMLAVRYGDVVSRMVSNRSDEVVLLTVFGLILVVAGVAEVLQVSAAVGAFLVGIAISGEVAQRVRTLLGPLRDLFAATFFLFFGLQIDPGNIPAVAALALGLGVVTAVTKVVTGWWAAGRLGVASRGRFRAGGALVARGEFSIVIAGLGVAAGVEPQLGPLAAAYVLFLAILGPVAARVVEPASVWVMGRRAARGSGGAAAEWP
jgi:CPA2 family monovalent cation:H+ antiporter-2